MQLAAVNDMLNRFDARQLGQFCSDTNTSLSPTQLQTSSIMISAIEDASGVVQSALFVAYKYTVDDLTTLDEESAALLTRITCDMCFIYLAQRRGYSYADKMPMLEDSYFLLQKLRNGERVLNIAGNEQAGLAASDYIGVQQQSQIGLVTSCWRYWPIGTGCSCFNLGG